MAQKLLSILILYMAAVGYLPAQKLEPTEVLFTINNDQVTAEEFSYVFTKNNFNDSTITKADVDEYLNLYINFKLKVKEAKALGYDTVTAFKNEYRTYKDQMSKPYMLETKVLDSLVEQAYERMKYEIDAGHILIRLDPNASPNDTLRAWQEISDIRRKALGGHDFAELAAVYSQEPNANQSKGRLGYFTALQMVYQFENEAYQTEVGEISNVVRTRFGYHIIKIYNKRPSRGQIKVAHIMIRHKEGDENYAKDKIFEIQQELADGRDWEVLVRQFSEDTRTKNSGGELNYVTSGQLPKQFEEAAFSLDSENDISDPVQTEYGWHIIKFIDREDLQDFKSLKPELENRVKRDERIQLNKQVVAVRLKKKGHFTENSAKVMYATSHVDSLANNKKDIPEATLSEVLFSIDTKKITLGQFLDYYLSQKVKSSGVTIYENLVQKELSDFEERELMKIDDYRYLAQEYYEGILLFNIMEDMVWKKAMEDTVGLAKFFEKNRKNYQWDDRIIAEIYDAANEEILKEVSSMVHKPFITLDSLVSADTSTINFAHLNTRIRNFTSLKPILDVYCDSTYSGEVKAIMSKGLAWQPTNHSNERLNMIHRKGEEVIIVIKSSSRKALETIFNKEFALSLQVTEGKFERGENELLDSLQWNTQKLEFEKDSRHYLVILGEIIPKGPKELHETRGIAISDYQNELEQKWIRKLKKKYKVSVNQQVLNKMYESFEKTN